MPALFVFLLKVNLALLLFCAGYYLVLRHLTFYTLNRIYLVTAILFASVYPQINLTGFAQRHQQMAKPVQSIIYHWQAPAEKLIEPLEKPDYWQWAEVIFWAGAALLAIRLLTQLYSLSNLYRNSKAARLYDHEVRLIKGDGGPFSFWRSIYVNPDRHEPAELKSILLHEQIHVNEWHTLDILLAEFSTIFYWFNPGIWLMKKAIRENVEFITDRKILNKGIDSKQYQYSLVNVSFAASPNTIVNHFNISTIKKRIIMMNAKRSSGIKLTRYAFLIPAVVALLLVFSISKAELVTKSNKAFIALKLTITKNSLFSNTAKSFVKPVIEAKSITAIKANTNDTIRNGGIFISTNDGDSINFVINGVRANKAAFKALNPKKVASMDALPAGDANKVLNQPGNKNTVFFVTTTDSETGKKFKEKLDKLTNRNFDADKDYVATGNSSSSPGNSFSFASDGIDSSKINMTTSKVIFVKTSPKLTLTKTINVKLDTVIVNNHMKSLTLNNINSAGASIFVTGDSIKTTINKSLGGQNVTVYTNGKAITYHNEPLTVQGYSSSSNKLKTITVNGFYSDHVTDIDNIQSKMIMIDGKEASEKDLKKLPASDIQSLSIKSGDDITKKYGDKAKNGVLFITTKNSN